MAAGEECQGTPGPLLCLRPQVPRALTFMLAPSTPLSSLGRARMKCKPHFTAPHKPSLACLTEGSRVTTQLPPHLLGFTVEEYADTGEPGEGLRGHPPPRGAPRSLSRCRTILLSPGVPGKRPGRQGSRGCPPGVVHPGNRSPPSQAQAGALGLQAETPTRACAGVPRTPLAPTLTEPGFPALWRRRLRQDGGVGASASREVWSVMECAFL